MHSEAELANLLQKAAQTGSLVDDSPYSRAELVEAFKKVTDHDTSWAAFTTVRLQAETVGSVGNILVSISGAKKGRKYTFSGLTSTLPKAGTLEPEAKPEKTAPNDRPEDRAHIPAHIALMLRRRAVAISLPKVRLFVGNRGGARVGHAA